MKGTKKITNQTVAENFKEDSLASGKALCEVKREGVSRGLPSPVVLLPLISVTMITLGPQTLNEKFQTYTKDEKMFS